MTHERLIQFLMDEVDKMIIIAQAKGQDYARGADALKNFRRHGTRGIIIRLDDKISRLDSLDGDSTGAVVKDEAVEDTARDIAIYALLYLALRKEQHDQQQPQINIADGVHYRPAGERVRPSDGGPSPSRSDQPGDALRASSRVERRFESGK